MGQNLSNNNVGLGFSIISQNSRENLRTARNTTMAKNRKKKNKSTEMAVDSTADHSLRDESQAMDTSETVSTSASVNGSLRKTKKGRPMKRSKNERKVKAIAKAISQSEKSLEKVSKSESKTSRTKSAKTLYD